MKTIGLFKEVALPYEETVTETFGFLGKKGGGKTYGAQRLFELLYGRGAQCVALDPVGNWRGLRIDAGGKTPGLDVPVFGGPQGDIPLDSTAGALIAQVVVESGTSVVLDVSNFRKNERRRFMTDFAEEFFHHKKKHISPVHLFIEEAHVFVPQRVQKGEERLLGAMEDIVRMGRNYGIGCSLISQRAASVNKDVLTQVECLLAFQTSSAQDKKALRDWVEEKDEDGVSLLAKLKSLQKGEAFFWSPSFLQCFEKVHITQKNTFNLSQTPTSQERKALNVKFKPLDLVNIEKRMQEYIKEHKENDPVELRRQVTLLKSKLAKAEAAPKPTELKISQKHIAALEKQVQAMLAACEKFEALHMNTATTVASLKQLLSTAQQTQQKPKPMPAVPEQVKMPLGPEVAMRDAMTSWRPPAGARAILAALDVEPLTKDSLAIRVVSSATSGTFNTYLSKLMTDGLIEKPQLTYRLTSAGQVFQRKYNATTVPEKGEPLIQAWINEFDGYAKRMVRCVADVFPNSLTKQQLADYVTADASSGTFNTYLSRIRSKGVFIEMSGDRTIALNSALIE